MKLPSRRGVLESSSAAFAVEQPNLALLDRLLNEPGAASRYSVSRMNAFLEARARR